MTDERASEVKLIAEIDAQLASIKNNFYGHSIYESVALLEQARAALSQPARELEPTFLCPKCGTRGVIKPDGSSFAREIVPLAAPPSHAAREAAGGDSSLQDSTRKP